MQTVGDDLTVTNIKRIKRAADEGACNALLLKVHKWHSLFSIGLFMCVRRFSLVACCVLGCENLGDEMAKQFGVWARQALPRGAGVLLYRTLTFRWCGPCDVGRKIAKRGAKFSYHVSYITIVVNWPSFGGLNGGHLLVSCLFAGRSGG